MYNFKFPRFFLWFENRVKVEIVRILHCFQDMIIKEDPIKIGEKEELEKNKSRNLCGSQ